MGVIYRYNLIFETSEGINVIDIISGEVSLTKQKTLFEYFLFKYAVNFHYNSFE